MANNVQYKISKDDMEKLNGNNKQTNEQKPEKKKTSV